MTTKGNRNMPRVEGNKEEEFDPMPIMPAPSRRLGEAAVDEDGEIDRTFVTGSRKGSTITLDDLDDDEKSSGPDQFEVLTSKLLKTISPDVRDAIKGTECFGRAWKDDTDVCPEVECELRDYCRNVYEQVTGDVEGDEVEEIEEPVVRQQKIITHRAAQGTIAAPAENRKFQKGKKKKKRKLGEAPEGKPVKQPWEIEKYKRRPYVTQGRPIDFIVDALWKEVGEPPSLPEKWKYVKSTSFEDRQYAASHFMNHYGRGLVVCRRASYHLYYNNGMHVCRIWVNGAGGGLIDMCPTLASAMEDEGFELHSVPEKNKRHVFQFFTSRCWLGTTEQAKTAAECIKAILNKMQVR
jgi:hypothetical protein